MHFFRTAYTYNRNHYKRFIRDNQLKATKNQVFGQNILWFIS